jgi:hypothetical protein
MGGEMAVRERGAQTFAVHTVSVPFGLPSALPTPLLDVGARHHNRLCHRLPPISPNLPYSYFSKLFAPHNMRTLSNSLETRMTEACEAYRSAEKPNIAKIAREHGLARETLRDHVKKSSQPRTARKPVNYALEGYQEEALVQWIVHMKDCNMLVTPTLIGAWANLALTRAGKPDQQVSSRWGGHIALSKVFQRA